MLNVCRVMGLVASLLLLVCGAASANSLTVNGAAAMSGAFGLDVDHGTSAGNAFVQDDSPTAESIYSASFLFRVPSATLVNGSVNVRQTILTGHGPNPRPNEFGCDHRAVAQVFQCWVFVRNAQLPALNCTGLGNQCGFRATQPPRIPFSTDTAYRVCMEWTTGAADSGSIAVALVPAAQSCPASGDAAYSTNDLQNHRTNLNFIRLGTPTLNVFGAGEQFHLHFDDFASFRSLNP